MLDVKANIIHIRLKACQSSERVLIYLFVKLQSLTYIIINVIRKTQTGDRPGTLTECEPIALATCYKTNTKH
jgi:hypothetical protein